MTEGQLKETCKGLPRHLAGPHAELAVADAAKPAHMSVNRHIIGRVSEDEVDNLAAEQTIEGLAAARVAA